MRNISVMAFAALSNLTSTTSLPHNSLAHHMERLGSNASEVLILDGGTGEELFLRGVPDDREIWSAKAVVDGSYHQQLQGVHRSFVGAGSNAITTNSYGITPGVGFDRDEILKYVTLAGKLARESVSGDESSPIIVFGSLGPLVESYRPDLIMDHLAGVHYYQLICGALSSNVDCFLAETMSSVVEAAQAIEAVGGMSANLRKPMMVSFTLNGKGAIRSGEGVTEAIPRLIDLADKYGVGLCGILFNCAEPESMTKAFREIHCDDNLRRLLKGKDIKMGAYANRLTPIPEGWSMAESEEAQVMRDDLTPQKYFEKFVAVWVRDLGVQMVGGCCGITPEHIAYLHSNLNQDKRA